MEELEKIQQEKKEAAINILNFASDIIGLERFDIDFNEFEQDYVIEYKSLEKKIIINKDVLLINTDELRLGILINFFSQYYFENEMEKDVELDKLDFVYQYSVDKAMAFAIYIMSFISNNDYYELLKQNDQYGNIKEILETYNNKYTKMEVIDILQKNHIYSKNINEILNNMQNNKNVS